MPSVITNGFTGTDGTGNGDFVDEIKLSGSIETLERRGTSGNFTKVASINPTNEFSIKGGGAPTLALGTGTVTLSELTGGVKIVQKKDHTQKNNDHDEFESSGKHYPNAT